jgi:hypothetical protein
MNTTTLQPLSIEERAAVARFSAKVVKGMKDRGATQALLVSQGNLFTALSENRFLRTVAKVLPWLAIGGFAGLRLLQLSPTMAIGSGLCMAVVMILRRAARKDVVASRILKKMGTPRACRLVLGLLFGSSLWMSQTNPLFAQFFQVAEDFFTTTFPDAGDVVPLVFGVIRALFLLYIAVSLVRVIQSARNDDDWQQLARAPMIIVMAVVIGDVLATLVIGGA